MQSQNQFGALIKKLRAQNNMTARQLADRLYVSQPTVTRWENGERLPDIHMLSRLAECLGVEPAELLDTVTPADRTPAVMVVEDETIILKGTMDTLERVLPHAQIYGARTAESALQCAQGVNIDVAFLDIQLGRKTGLELAQELSRLYPRVNIIFLTAYSDYMPDAWRLHASGFMLKPLDETALRQELSALRYPVRGLNR